MAKKRIRYLLEGAVQGVGLRYRAYHAAERFGVCGFVENCYDGTVLLEAEGEPEDIERMLQAIEQGRFVEIEKASAKEIPCEDALSFEIR